MRKREIPLALFALILAFYLLLPNIAIAGETSNAFPNIFVLDSIEIQGSLDRGFLFFFSTVHTSSYNGNIYSFFSDINISSKTDSESVLKSDGNIYSLFSKITIADDADFSGKIHTFSSVISNKSKLFNIKEVDPILPALSHIFEKIDDTNYSDEIPTILFSAIMGVLQFIICLLVFAIGRSFIEQGSVLLYHEPLHMINYGLATYFIFIALAFIFILSVILIPVSLLFLIALYIMVLIGEASLAIIIGHFILMHLNKKFTPLVNLSIGLVLIEGMKLIPYIGVAFTFVFLPILAIGTVITTFCNGFIRKIFYETPFEQENNKNMFSREQIRDIILKQKD